MKRKNRKKKMKPYDGASCPVCGSDEVRGGDVDFGGADTIFRNCDCADCNAQWTETYDLNPLVTEVMDSNGNECVPKALLPD